MSEYITCKICGALINKETENASIPENSNAFKIQAVKKENEELKQKVNDLEGSLGKTQELLNPKEEEHAEIDNGNDDW